MQKQSATFTKKIPVAILGATGCVGQKFIQLLSNHPWFEIKALYASERSAGKAYGDSVNWLMPTPIPKEIASMKVRVCTPGSDAKIAFSGLDSSVAEEIEKRFAAAGLYVVSNSSAHRMSPDVPLLIAEVNPDHLELLKAQHFEQGKIITNPNCSVIGIALALKPLIDQFGIDSVHVVTMQALSGAGHPGVASIDICDNVIPYINGEETKVELEPLKIFGNLNHKGDQVERASFKISAHCNRVAVSDGHLACISLKLKTPATLEQIKEAWINYQGLPQALNLPTAPLKPLHYFEESHYPQPRLHRSLDKEMAVSIGRLRPCSLFDYKFCLLSHNTMRGAAGASVLNAELLVATRKIFE